jgi:cytochrome c-type biogenesis protein
VYTAIPMLIVVSLVTMGRTDTKSSIKSLRKSQKFIRILGGSVLLVVGLVDTLIYWLL